jgi:hypothetical protein
MVLPPSQAEQNNGNSAEMSLSLMRASKKIEERILKERKEIVMKLD